MARLLLQLLCAMQVVFELHPLQTGGPFWNAMAVMYLSIFGAYWLYNLVHLVLDLRAAAAIRSFTTDKLGLSERQLRTVTWPEVAHRIVQVPSPHAAFAGPESQHFLYQWTCPAPVHVELPASVRLAECRGRMHACIWLCSRLCNA